MCILVSENILFRELVNWERTGNFNVLIFRIGSKFLTYDTHCNVLVFKAYFNFFFFACDMCIRIIHQSFITKPRLCFAYLSSKQQEYQTKLYETAKRIKMSQNSALKTSQI